MESHFKPKYIKKKWFDIKIRAKCDVAIFKKEADLAGGGSNPIPKQTEMQLKISSIIGSTCTEGIPGTNFCDTDDNLRENNGSTVLVRPM